MHTSQRKEHIADVLSVKERENGGKLALTDKCVLLLAQ
jgi:hypothetical protein